MDRWRGRKSGSHHPQRQEEDLPAILANDVEPLESADQHPGPSPLLEQKFSDSLQVSILGSTVAFNLGGEERPRRDHHQIDLFLGLGPPVVQLGRAMVPEQFDLEAFLDQVLQGRPPTGSDAQAGPGR